MTIQSGFPIGVQQSDNTGTFGGAQRPERRRGCRPGDDRVTGPTGSPRRITPPATWLNPAAFTTAPANTFGNAPRTITDVRTPPQQNVDLSISKNFRLGGTRYAQFRIEVVNLLNRVTTSGIATTAGSGTFGQISGQSGFMRLTQFSFRYLVLSWRLGTASRRHCMATNIERGCISVAQSVIERNTMA